MSFVALAVHVLLLMLVCWMGAETLASDDRLARQVFGQLQQGQSTPYGTVQQVWHNATPDTINNSGIGTYLQTCDQNGNPIIVKVG